MLGRKSAKMTNDKWLAFKIRIGLEEMEALRLYYPQKQFYFRKFKKNAILELCEKIFVFPSSGTETYLHARAPIIQGISQLSPSARYDRHSVIRPHKCNITPIYDSHDLWSTGFPLQHLYYCIATIGSEVERNVMTQALWLLGRATPQRTVLTQLPAL